MKLKRDKLLLKEFIEKTVKEALKEFVDEPKGGPFGKVLFAPQRADGTDREENTPEEEEVLIGIEDHYQINDDSKLEKYFKPLLKLSKQGKYEKILVPPSNTSVYRLTDSTFSIASKLLGIPEEELRSEYGPTKEAWYVKTNKNYISRSKIQSWTAYPQNLDPELGSRGGNRDLTLLLEANTSNNDFLMNPTAASRIASIQDFVEEHEVIAQNPVKLTGAAFYIGRGNRYDIFDKLLDAINAKEFAKKPEIK